MLRNLNIRFVNMKKVRYYTLIFLIYCGILNVKLYNIIDYIYIIAIKEKFYFCLVFSEFLKSI